MCANHGKVTLPLEHLANFECLHSLVRFFCEFLSPLQENNSMKVVTLVFLTSFIIFPASI